MSRRAGVLGQVALLGLAAAAWEAVARSGVASPIVFPSLATIGRALGASLAAGELGYHFRMTLLEIAAAFAAAAAAGVPAGLAAGLLPDGRALLQPLVWLAFSVPLVALVPFFTIAFGLGMASKIVFAAVYAFFPICVNTLAGVRGIDRMLLPVARSLGAGPWQRATKFLLPACLPAILAGMEGGMSLAVIGVLATEMLASLFGIGYLLARAMTGIETGKVYGLVLLSLATAYAANRAIHALRSLVRRELARA